MIGWKSERGWLIEKSFDKSFFQFIRARLSRQLLSCLIGGNSNYIVAAFLTKLIWSKLEKENCFRYIWMVVEEKLCLKWNDFQGTVLSSFGQLRLYWCHTSLRWSSVWGTQVDSLHLQPWLTWVRWSRATWRRCWTSSTKGRQTFPFLMKYAWIQEAY